MLAEKLYFWVFALVERLQKGVTEETPNEAKFVCNGKAEIEIRISVKSAEAFSHLKSLGFEITENNRAKILIGKIPIEKLAELTEIPEVQYVLPNIKTNPDC